VQVTIVKIVHNGIRIMPDMQLFILVEKPIILLLLCLATKPRTEMLVNCLKKWELNGVLNKATLLKFLADILQPMMTTKTGAPLVDMHILDSAGQKGTGVGDFY